MKRIKKTLAFALVPGASLTDSPVKAMDFDADGDVDLVDFAAFQQGFSGQGKPYSDSSFDVFDQDFDNDIDLDDWAAFVAAVTGPGANGYLIVEESKAVFTESIPGAVYPRRRIDLGGSVVITAASVRIAPPEDDLDPYGYGPTGDYALLCSGPGLCRAQFAEGGIYFLEVSSSKALRGTGFVAVLVDVDFEEVDDTCELTKFSRFTPPVGNMVITDAVGGQNRRDYYAAHGANLVEVTNVNQAIQEIRSVGPIETAVFAGHTTSGAISVGGGAMLISGRHFGKTATGTSLGEYGALVHFLTGIRGFVSDNIYIIGCCPGDPPAGQVFVNSLSTDLASPIPLNAFAKKGKIYYKKRFSIFWRA